MLSPIPPILGRLDSDLTCNQIPKPGPEICDQISHLVSQNDVPHSHAGPSLASSNPNLSFYWGKWGLKLIGV